jgi:hypothetical protein
MLIFTAIVVSVGHAYPFWGALANIGLGVILEGSLMVIDINLRVGNIW